MSPPGFIAGFVGVVVAAMLPILAGLVAFVLGGCRAGRIKKSTELIMRLADLPRFQEMSRARIAELGFEEVEPGTRYLQGSNKMKEGGAPSLHSEKEKVLVVETDASRAEEVRVRMEASFTDIIICDTGEAAHLKAVLDYVSGEKDAVKMVPSRAIMGSVALAGGVVLGLAGYFMSFEQVQKWWFAILIVGVTNVVAGFQAFQAIRKSRGKLVGMWEPWAGVILGVVGLALALVPVVKAELMKLFGS